MSINPDKVRVLDPLPSKEDLSMDRQLRPATLDEFIGQPKLKEQMNICIDAARERGDTLSHILFYGPPGLGKTTLAHIVGNEMGVPVRMTSGPVLERAGDMAGMLTNLQPSGVLFVDECHRLPVAVEELMYPAMEDFKLDIMIGDGPAAKSVRMPLKPFTFVGATTRIGLLTTPLYDRFDIVLRLDYYAAEELAEIVLRSAKKLKIQIDEEGAQEIAKRARSTPRVANRLLRRVRDFAQVRAEGSIDSEIADQALTLFEVDTQGLDGMDTTYLLTIIEKFTGGPVGIETLSAAIGEDRGTLEEVVEPFLIQKGFLERTRSGRVATQRAWRHLGLRGGPTIGGELDLDPGDDTT